MNKVVFVGDKPSKTNISELVPFVGAKCFNTLITWIKYLKPDYYIVVNSDDPQDWQRIRDMNKAEFKFVALGKNASQALKFFEIEHYTLPHPSGLNRKLNNKEFLNKELITCRNYICGLR